uniref:Uncharacterized protein n=1 Tax=Arundo donax TaxID=35708 RepID=A0A0A9HV10_ARUDO
MGRETRAHCTPFHNPAPSPPGSETKPEPSKSRQNLREPSLSGLRSQLQAPVAL